MGNSEDFGEPAAACLACQPSSVISQTCCSRNAKETNKKNPPESKEIRWTWIGHDDGVSTRNPIMASSSEHPRDPS